MPSKYENYLSKLDAAEKAFDPERKTPWVERIRGGADDPWPRADGDVPYEIARRDYDKAKQVAFDLSKRIDELERRLKDANAGREKLQQLANDAIDQANQTEKENEKLRARVDELEEALKLLRRPTVSHEQREQQAPGRFKRIEVPDAQPVGRR